MTKLHIEQGNTGFTLINSKSKFHLNNRNKNDPAILYRFQQEMIDFGEYLKLLYDTQNDRQIMTDLKNELPL